MESIRYFYRSYAVPGEAMTEQGRNVSVSTAVVARAHYRIYQRTRTVVFTGIDRTVPTSVKAFTIISLIAAKEKINPHEYSWFDLRTAMQDEQIKVGQYDFFVIFLRPGTNPIQGDCAVKVDCPEPIKKHFARYIYSELFRENLEFSPTEFQRRADRPAADDDDSGEDDDRDRAGRHPDNPVK